MHYVTSFLKACIYIVVFSTLTIISKKLIIQPVFQSLAPSVNTKAIQAILSILIQSILFFLFIYFVPKIDLPFLGHDMSGYNRSGQAMTFAIGCLLASLAWVFILIGMLMTKQVQIRPSSQIIGPLFTPLLTALAFFFVLALFEEIIFRGILFTLLESSYGQTRTLVIVTLIFSILHLGNQNISLKAFISLLLGGLLLNLMRLYTGNISLSLGFHFLWNLLPGLLGLHISGDNEIRALFQVSLSGKTLLTGGEFGPEASIISLVILALLVGLFIYFIYFLPKPCS